MARKFFLYVHADGHIAKRPLPKLTGMSEAGWREVAQQQARSWGAERFAFKAFGRWRVYDTWHPTPLKMFPDGAPQEAVEMYLIAKECAHG